MDDRARRYAAGRAPCRLPVAGDHQWTVEKVVAARTSPLDVAPQVAKDLDLESKAVASVLQLLDEGATVPFIARYRKERTGTLDEVAIASIMVRSAYVRDLEERRHSILQEIDKQGKLTDEIRNAILACKEKARLEDLYLPYKPKRRTRATLAKERGLAPLAEQIWGQQGAEDPMAAAARFVDETKGVKEPAAALAGARDICAERIAETAEGRAMVREVFASTGQLRVAKTKEYADAVTKFDTYAEYGEPISRMPSHRVLAIRRGEAENVLRARIEIDEERASQKLFRFLRIRRDNAWGQQLELATRDSLKRLIAPSIESDVRNELKREADITAVEVFARNLRELLLGPPLGASSVIGIDPGQRTGCKVAVVDGTGRLLEHTTLYLVQGDRSLEQARQALLSLCRKHEPKAIAVGNGTHGRETLSFARDVLSEHGLSAVVAASVNEAGASVYSASEIARKELPDLDVSVRGAVSIARRLQDPLAELVKIDPKSIGVGQYQHDVHQPLLVRKLEQVVEVCVNAVGVELNTASSPLLARVAGVGDSLAKRILARREERGPFRSRRELLDVSGIGPRTFEQAAGFLRIRGASHPLDASAVHPERYKLVGRMAKDLGVALQDLVGDITLADRVDWRRYVSDDVGEPTLRDILDELRKPGRDPRNTFEAPEFREDVRTLEDLVTGMELQGVVTNVTAFGAFVDIGVHQDGLVHVSKLADRFVRDPNEVVKVGDRIPVTVLGVDLERRRISLSARKSASPPQPPKNRGGEVRSSPAEFKNRPFGKLGKR